MSIPTSATLLHHTNRRVYVERNFRQELHNYLQEIYRNSNVLSMPVQEIGRGIWRADVLSAFTLSVIQNLVF